MKIVDPHVHLFNLSQGDYHWLKPNNPPFWPDKPKIVKNFTEHDLHLKGDDLVGFVHIEAGFNNNQPWQEIDWLENTCTLPFRTIAAIDLRQDTSLFKHTISLLIQRKSIVGVRHIVEHEAEDLFSQSQVIKNLALLAKHHLIFELQMPINNWQTTSFVVKQLKALPTLQIVINHAGWPPKSKDDEQNTPAIAKWQKGLIAFSQLMHCSIKCSGFEMIDRNYSFSSFEYVVRQCVDVFGSHRVMLASNFPLCLLSKGYQHYWQSYLKHLSYTEKVLTQLCFLNAIRFYKLSIKTF